MFLELTNSNCFKNKRFYDQWFQNHFLNVYSSYLEYPQSRYSVHWLGRICYLFHVLSLDTQ
jgi:hypothetical protein